MDIVKYNAERSLKPIGFDNIGHTCYYNAMLQSLLSCTSFVEAVEDMDYVFGKEKLLAIIKFTIKSSRDEPTKHDIAQLGPYSWKAMIEQLAKESREIASFAVGQQCAYEGFCLFLQSVEQHEYIQRLFTHRRRIRIFCPDCEKYFSNVDEINNHFVVDITETGAIVGKKNMNDFLSFQASEIDDDCVCSLCHVRSRKRRESVLVMIPEILFVVSKKFKYSNDGCEKLNVTTEFPEQLVFKTKNKNELIYSAVAMIQHHGNSNDGHYIAVCKRLGQWYYINDRNVSLSAFKPDSNTYGVFYHFE